MLHCELPQFSNKFLLTNPVQVTINEEPRLPLKQESSLSLLSLERLLNLLLSIARLGYIYMEKGSSKENGVAFFQEAIEQWLRLAELFKVLRKHSPYTMPRAKISEADSIITWFQENYDYHAKSSGFGLRAESEDGKKADLDPIFDVIFRGANIETICANPEDYAEEINGGVAYLRGHLGAIKMNQPSIMRDAAFFRIERTLLRFHLVVYQLRRRRKGKQLLLISDEYDVQDLLHALLRLDFDDIRYTISFFVLSFNISFNFLRSTGSSSIGKSSPGLILKI